MADCLSQTGVAVSEEVLFSRLADDLATQGFSIQPNALPHDLVHALAAEVSALSDDWFHRAGVGRRDGHHLNRFNRTDQVCWIEGTTAPCREWVQCAERLRLALNRALCLGLFSYESHYARYQPGDYYKRHLDAFQGEANRRVSTVLYLNPGWGPEDGGELVLYANPDDRVGIRVTPQLGTLVCFLSEEFPHEVLPAARTRSSIAGWFRVNSSTTGRVDPPR